MQLLLIIFGTLILNVITFAIFRKRLIKSLWNECGTSKFGVIIAKNAYGSELGSVEIEELQNTATLTKVKIINIYPKHSYSRSEIISRLDITNNVAWVETRNIQWFTNASQYARDKRLTDLLQK